MAAEKLLLPNDDEEPVGNLFQRDDILEDVYFRGEEREPQVLYLVRLWEQKRRQEDAFLIVADVCQQSKTAE